MNTEYEISILCIWVIPPEYTVYKGQEYSGGFFMAEMDKTFYSRRVVYLDYLERGEKVKNGGFVKWEIREDTSWVQIRIRGLYPTDTLQGELLLMSAGRLYTADSIGLQYGTGEYVASWRNDDLADTGIPLAECDGVWIRLSEKRQLRGQWRERVEREGEKIPAEDRREVPEEKQADNGEEPLEESREEISAESQEENPEENPEEPLTEKLLEIQERGVKEEKQKDSRQQEAPAEDKWVQLNRLFPKLRPFGDGREYLSLTPRDFVVLERHWHMLVQNSFLLHGYYNYGHVVLMKTENRGEELFYLGVPGVYYEKEKQAALMFGFEGFEAADEQAAEGGFGYYMKRVEI